MAPVDSATFQALGLTLTVLGLVAAFLVWRRRGPASGLRATAWALLPLAAAMTGTLRLGWEIAGAVVDWAVRLAFSPIVWAGIVLAGMSVALFVVSGLVRGRTSPTPSEPEPVAPGSTPALQRDRGRPAVGDDDMADIETLLKKHGIG